MVKTGVNLSRRSGGLWRVLLATVTAVALGSFFGLAATQVAAGPKAAPGSVIDQHNTQPAGVSAYGSESASQPIAQTFTAGITGRLTDVVIGASNTSTSAIPGSTGPFTLEVTSTNADGSPNYAHVLGSGTVTVPIVPFQRPLTFTDVDFALTAPVPIQAGTHYAIVLPVEPGLFFWATVGQWSNDFSSAPPDSYPGGQAYTGSSPTPGPPGWSSFDWTFQTFVTPSTPAATCPRVFFLGTRGSGDTLQQASGVGLPDLTFYKAFVRDAHLTSHDISLWANPYSAVSIANVLKSTTVSRDLSLYRISRSGGEGFLHAQIVQALKKIATQPQCDSSTVLLAGYSQGADVTADVYSALTGAQRKKILGVVLFGDPQFNENSTADSITALQQRTQLKLIHSGLLGRRSEYPKDAYGHVLSYCHARDPVCQGKAELRYGTGAHTNYSTTGEPQDAAQYFANHL